ncbi:MAG TPA: hypothetical protein VK178_16045 [Opitutaceae bacterium]|nr:hypothetical protein [Opitutaceae bacterium]
MAEDAFADRDAVAEATPQTLRVPWAPLVSVAATTLHSCTPFRRLGLSALAGPRDIQRRLEQLRLSVELGAPEFNWAFAPNPPPSAEQLRDSAQQLKDTLTRLLHEFFWFWPASYPDDGPDPAMDALLAGDADAAFLRWQNDAAVGRIVAVHNLAIFHQLAALEVERSGGAIEEETTEWWKASIEEWTQVRASGEFWELVRQRILLLNDARLPVGLLDAMRGTLPDAFCGIHASLAIARAQKAQWHEATAHVRFARQVHDVPARAERALEGAIGKVVQGVDLLLRDTTRRLTGDGSVGLALTAGLLAEAADELEVIETICGRESEIYREVSTRVVDAALEGIIAYQRRTLDSCGVLPWLTHLTTLAATPEVRRRLEETADILHGNAIVEKLPPVDPAAGPEAAEAAEFEAAYRLLLEEFVPGVERLELGARARTDYLANVRRALRELAHAACYQLENFDLAARALATAAEISEGAERAALSREREQLLLEIVRRKAREFAAEHAQAAAEVAALAESPPTVRPAPAAEPRAGEDEHAVATDAMPEAAENAAGAAAAGKVSRKKKPVQSELPLWSEAAALGGEATATAAEAGQGSAAGDGVPLRAFGGNQLRLEFGGHLLELDPARLVFDGVALAPDEITGLRYGVEEAEGAPRCHRIAWCSAETVVTLDETNLFGAGCEEPTRTYEQVLEALYGIVVPGLIARLVEWVQHGETVPLGPAQLRREGLVFTERSFNWPSDSAVPYSEIAHALDDGEFVVLRAGDVGDSERFALADVWNAAIAGHVIDALANGTPPNDES